jgi:renal tumor antigen
LKAQSIKTGKYVAIKCMKNHFDSIEQVNNLREIQALRRLSPHPHVVKLLEILFDEPTGRLALVFELLDLNLYEWIRGRRHYLPEAKVQNYMFQLLKSIDHMHRNGIFHRDVKPENVMLVDDTLKLADFGSCRGIYSKQPYTEYISTRWYRAPECLLTDGYYSFKMDIWGVGCVFFEVLALFPLFPGTNELDQINKIHNIMGTPGAELLKAFQEKASHMEFNFPVKTGTGIDQLILMSAKTQENSSASCSPTTPSNGCQLAKPSNTLTSPSKENKRNPCGSSTKAQRAPWPSSPLLTIQTTPEARSLEQRRSQA